jgi:hypothetical protein
VQEEELPGLQLLHEPLEPREAVGCRLALPGREHHHGHAPGRGPRGDALREVRGAGGELHHVDALGREVAVESSGVQARVGGLEDPEDDGGEEAQRR